MLLLAITYSLSRNLSSSVLVTAMAIDNVLNGAAWYRGDARSQSYVIVFDSGLEAIDSPGLPFINRT